MKYKPLIIAKWLLTGIVAFIFIGSAFGKIVPSTADIEVATKFGLTAQNFFYIGILELFCLLLFLIPRTGVIGTLFLAAYMGGAIATHLEHNEGIVPQCIIQAFIWIVAALRFPEITQRLIKGNIQ